MTGWQPLLEGSRVFLQGSRTAMDLTAAACFCVLDGTVVDAWLPHADIARCQQR